MRYQSTRGQAATLSFKEVLLAGLASDGGLYVPVTWPQLSSDDINALRGKPYTEAAFVVMSLFVDGKIGDDANAESKSPDAFSFDVKIKSF